jgi:hydrophobe/amphiphile efflux-1 (HAE1) family protein
VLSEFFIERPRFAIVISLVITLAGTVAFFTLPVDRFPDLAPPTVKVSTSYPGADAQVLEQAVTAPIEQQINGVKNMLYMSSVSSNDGNVQITVTFDVGTDLDIATVQVQNRVQRAMPMLPQEVQRQGVVVQESSPNMLMVINLRGNRPEYDELFLGNYVTLYVKDALARIGGVGDVTVFGARDYGMRVWLEPDRLKQFGLTTADVTAAIREQNELIPAGRIGSAPTLPDQRIQLSVSTKGRLASVEEFGDIIIRANPDGSMIRVRDVGDVELGAQNYDRSSRLNGETTATIGLYQLPGSNALAVRDRVYAELERLSASFPPGLEYVVSYDSTEVIEASIAEVQLTLLEAVFLVVLVVFIFLANFRATVVPGLAVPVSLIGTFALMAVIGFSVNTLSLFGLILAIGIVVDDAIVVVETTMRNIEDRGMERKEATKAAMNEVFGAVIASTLVLLAVFVPVAFMPGLTGRLYNQFALTISCAVLISTLNAITLSPALCSLLLEPAGADSRLKRSFDRIFIPTRDAYVRLVERVLALRWAMVGVFAGLLACVYLLFQMVPGGFVPTEDDGVLFMHVQLPDAASLNRTEDILRRVEGIVQAEDTIENVISIAGFNMLGGANASNAALVILKLKNWSERSDPSEHVAAVRKRIQGATWQIPEASVFVFTPAPIPGLGNTGGSEYYLENRAGGSIEVLAQVSNELQAAAMAQPAIGGTMSTFRASVPRVYIELDRNQAKKLGVSMKSIADVLSTNLGSLYANDFTLFGRNFRVMLAAQRSFTTDPLDILSLYVPNQTGEQVPLSAIADVEVTTGPETITRFNLFPSVLITALPAPGRSSGEVIETMENVSAAVLPPELGYEWSGSAVQEKKAAGASGAILAMALVLVFLFLVAQYESFTLPMSVMAVVPMAALGALLFQYLAGLALDVYCQVGLVLLVGLTAKTAILLVELAKQRVEEGLAPTDAIVEACRLRFRAVLMTALTFLLGMVPLLISTGAGAASRQSLGTAVFGGTLVGIIFTLLLVPVFFVLVQQLRRTAKRSAEPSARR